jgi:hypothetical protein
MTESILLVEGKDVSKDSLASLSLRNAKQLMYGRYGEHGYILHVAATTQADLGQAVLDFCKVTGVKSVLTLAARSGA